MMDDGRNTIHFFEKLIDLDEKVRNKREPMLVIS
jgi:hypothetical protein